MATQVETEVLEGLKALQTKIEEGEKSIAFYVNQVSVSQEALARETARVAQLQVKYDETRTRLGIAKETLSFDDTTNTIKTATEVAAEEAAK